jgi:eukaryotic-like serine/threonine-protein kinase
MPAPQLDASSLATAHEPVPGAERADGMRSMQSTLADGRYRIVEVLGEGGMSAVYGAFDQLLERPVAIKVVNLTRSVTLELVAREARVLASVRHPNVVTVHALHTESVPPFLVMERLAGGTLEQRLAAGRPTLAEGIEILAQIAAGLDAIHAAGLIHGDVKPSNVLFDDKGRVKLADFGLVPMLERMRPGEVLGTPAYIPPERALGRMPPGGLAHQSDIYSFGCVAFEVLTGRPVFEGSWAPALVHAHATRIAPRVSSVSTLSRSFDVPIAHALAKSTSRRPESASALVEQLRRAMAGAGREGQPLRILVVDDDSDMRAMLRVTLAPLLPGAIIESASDGEGALSSIDHATPSVILLDLSMPGLGGVELIREVRMRAPGACVLVITGDGSGAEWRAARELGAARFFIKPVAIAEIVRAIRSFVDSTDPVPGIGAAEPSEPSRPLRESVQPPGSPSPFRSR